MEIRHYNVYKFDELPDDSKAKVLENYRDINTDHDWFEFTLDEWTDKLTRQGFENAEIYFSGFYSQGDGACFKCSNIDIKKFLKGRRVAGQYQQDIKAFDSGDARGWITLSGHYNHEYSMNLEGYEMSDKLENFIIDEAREQARKIYKDLEREYWELQTDENVIETILANDYNFTLDGKIA